ncbi:MAG: Pseudopaline exporter CntI [Chlamydiae bacterium]|nr:Pseudopaline exporter CntI [Chlamydiota bacterium]
MDQDDTLKKNHRPSIGIPLIIIACFCNAAMATTAKFISVNYQLPSQILVFARFSISFIILLPLLLLFPRYRPIKETLKIKILQPYLVRNIFGLLSLYAYFYAIQHISLSSAVLLVYTSPLFIPIAFWVWKGVKITKRLWVGLVVGFIGVVLIMAPKYEKLQIGYCIGLLAGITAAVSYVAARLQSHSEKPICVNFYFFLFTAIASFALCAKTFFVIAPSFSLKIWLSLFVMSAFGALFQGLLIIALQWTQVRFLGAFLYLAVAFAMLLDWAVFTKKPGIFSIFGLVLVFLGALLMTILDPERQKTANKTMPS